MTAKTEVHIQTVKGSHEALREVERLALREVMRLIGGGNPPLAYPPAPRYTWPVKDNDLAEAICSLTCAVIALTDRERHQNNNQAVLQRIAEMEERMAIKLSELTNEVSGLRTQVKKIWSEQQTRYDALVVKYDALTATLANQELDPAAQAEVEGFKADLKGFDDSIPDTTA